MPVFSYKAKDYSGNTVNGILDTYDEEQLASALAQKNLYLIHASPAKEMKQIKISGGKVSREEIINFTIHLSRVISGGIPLIEGVQDFENETRNRKFKEIIRKVRENIQSGSSLSEALSQHSQAFSTLYVNMVKAGEATGHMEMVLNEMVSFLEWEEEFHENIKRATTYPIVVLSAVGFLITLLFGFAFPRIMGILTSMHVSLPFTTRAIIAVSGFIEHDWYYIFAGLIAAVLGIKFIKKTPGGKLLIDSIKLNVPILGSLTRKIALSRFAHYLKLLLQAGIGISQALSIVESVVGNRVISQAINTAREKVLQGEALSRSLQKTGEFSSLVIRMISIGETTGNLEDTLDKVCRSYDQEVPRTVKKLMSAFEPILIVFLALIIMVVALSIYLPIYSAIGQMGK